MCGRAGQLNVTHALTTHLGQRDFNAALLADDTAMLQTLVLAAQTLVVLDRAKDLCTEQTVALRLEGSIVDGLRLFDFSERPGADFFRRGQADADRIEMLFFLYLLEQIE